MHQQVAGVARVGIDAEARLAGGAKTGHILALKVFQAGGFDLVSRSAARVKSGCALNRDQVGVAA